MKTKMTGAGFWVVGIGIVFLVGMTIAFAYQTWELVSWLMTKEALFMKVATVFAFDIMACFWGALDMFYIFKRRYNGWIAKGMSIISFALATVASGIQMYLSATDVLHYKVNTDVVSSAYVLVIVTLAIQLSTMWVVLRSEYAAHADGDSQPVRTSSPAPRPMGPPARVGLAQQGEVKAPLAKPEPKEEA